MEFLSWLIREYAKGFYSLRLAVLGTLSPVSPSPYQGEGDGIFSKRGFAPSKRGFAPLIYPIFRAQGESKRSSAPLIRPALGDGNKRRLRGI